jgi:hypothetical protein
MDARHDIENIRLTSAEIGQLWATYMSDSASVCVLSYFNSKVQDLDIKILVEYALNLSREHITSITDIFNSVKLPIPHGFKEDDVNMNAERLFSDAFMLSYIKYMARLGLLNYGDALPMCPRDDVRRFFSDCIRASVELSNKADDLMLAKGLYIRAPYMTVPSSIDFVEKQSYMHKFLGENRPLNATEIAHTYINIQTNILGKAFTMALSQVVKDREVKKYILRGKEIAAKHIEVLSEDLRGEDLPSPITWDSDVMASTEPPFSDKLMLFHVTALNAFGMAGYGIAISKNMRSDMAVKFTRLSAEVAKYAEDGMNLMIDKGWMEKMPEAINREELAMK